MPRRFARRLAAVVALVLAACGEKSCPPPSTGKAPAAPAAAAEGKVLRELWNVVRISDAKVGWEHVVVRRTADAPARISTTRETKMSIRRMGQDLETSGRETTVEAEDGTLLSQHSVEKQSAVETTTEVTFAGGKAAVKTTALGQTHEATVPVPPDLVGPWKIDAAPREAGYPAGKKFEFKTFLREMGGPKTVHVTVIGPEEVQGKDGAKTTLTKLEQKIEGLPITIATWAEADGTPVRTLVEMIGLKFEGVRATQAEATGEAGANEPLPDLLEKTMITAKALFPHARTADSAELRVRPREPGGKVMDLTDERQRVGGVGKDGSVSLTTNRVVPPADHGGKRPLADPPAEIAPFLASSSSIQADDPLLATKAKEAVGAETDAWKAAQAIEAWVYKNLAKKNMGVAFASALEVCKNLEGDCTEHSVLVAGLSRAAGIPARVVMGLEYLSGIWGGHAWTEVWIAGRWYALDGTLGYGSVDPFHLAVAKSAMADGSFGADLVTGLLTVIGSIDVEVVEVVKGGKSIRPSADDAVVVEGQRYSNKLFGIAFEAPAGSSVRPAKTKGLGDVLAEVVRADGDEAKLVTVHVADAPAGFALAPKGSTVDGRPSDAKVHDSRKHVIVLVDDTIFVFEAAAGDEAAKALDALLATVDFEPAG